MTELLERAVATARTLPPHLQDAIANFILTFADEEASFAPLSAAEEASMALSLKQSERGEFASEEEIEAILGGR